MALMSIRSHNKDIEINYYLLLANFLTYLPSHEQAFALLNKPFIHNLFYSRVETDMQIITSSRPFFFKILPLTSAVQHKQHSIRDLPTHQDWTSSLAHAFLGGNALNICPQYNGKSTDRDIT